MSFPQRSQSIKQGMSSNPSQALLSMHVDPQICFACLNRLNYKSSVYKLALQEVAPQPYTDKESAAGISSFGMSGVNAHAVFARPDSNGNAIVSGNPSQTVWQRYSHWPVPPAHHFLQTAVMDRKAGLCRWSCYISLYSSDPCVYGMCKRCSRLWKLHWSELATDGEIGSGRISDCLKVIVQTHANTAWRQLHSGWYEVESQQALALIQSFGKLNIGKVWKSKSTQEIMIASGAFDSFWNGYKDLFHA